METRTYVVIFERADGNWSAYAPDVPGCMATGQTRDKAERNIKEALEFHIEGLKREGLPIPEPHTIVERISVPEQQ